MSHSLQVYGLWSLVVEAFERGISLGVKKHEFRRPSQSRLLSPLREGSDGEARPIDLLARIGHPEFPQVLGDTTVLSVSVYGGAGNSRADPAMLTSVDGELSISAPLQVALSYSLSA
ncbi:uncharacterized protein FFB20_13574 [Fusarium fujikuroi]|uniref:Uncharacterized protein n=1 Tax=Gibberella fujikuroi (strain CBS 195.34 / IMI 58289 / NRRL A-6831) TaxID=1279085 RepID=S0EMC3_GIBF5|nr:uncharacterized protein FFUJ_14159 [Fusarium fujikuroi IMI 58289]KLO85027.1 uncharacterized protein LW93_5979 [Fusarium fujikuroi]KLO90096.1 uncharacterized protein Y057_8451 [Fusarium fujikuroi]KLP10888.1 uncharacterized protein LW94_8779 [Fusarium fujikuroi]CCT76208.1 uncharacterized protein FFUJ_14159 [Fusarium fujikuroi IMI 58289]SCO10581.1 uncharacterized protein FFB20_13574 [Fusarium fujikuroi]